MNRIILVRYGEISLKGLNRNYFIDCLVRNIRTALKSVCQAKTEKIQGRIIIHLNEADLDQALAAVTKIFGIVSVSPGVVISSDMADIENQVRIEAQNADFKTFRVSVKRSDKSFPMTSMDLARHLGAVVLRNCDGISVDLHNPDLHLWVEVRGKKQTYVYHQIIAGRGGMPVGTAGRTALLLSGGIDSPVAGYMMAKRGLELIGVHFHSFPFTSDRAKEKVVDLAKILAQYTGKLKLYIVPFTEIQTKIVELCPERQTILIIRRYMMRITERIAKIENAKSLTTGESLGQVASQTQESLTVTNDVVEMPVFRPLIGMDKVEIVDIAQHIGTFETSTLPYEDCCTVFVPKHPETKPKLDRIRESEKEIELLAEDLIATAIEEAEILEL
ncbi:MAG: tRNA 4-thiouridine(8) synthase ThiI [Eubacteriaceae bacterium]|jgi:thiamine biosynthesis protein ThiI|nr:tRNA 4-thiouridine(8) synthase ThiI [Eubacteriaceae bacterium]